MTMNHPDKQPIQAYYKDTGANLKGISLAKSGPWVLIHN